MEASSRLTRERSGGDNEADPDRRARWRGSRFDRPEAGLFPAANDAPRHHMIAKWPSEPLTRDLRRAATRKRRRNRTPRPSADWRQVDRQAGKLGQRKRPGARQIARGKIQQRERVTRSRRQARRSRFGRTERRRPARTQFPRHTASSCRRTLVRPLGLWNETKQHPRPVIMNAGRRLAFPVSVN